MKKNLYKETKRKLAHNYRGYDLGKIMAYDIMMRIYENRFSLIKDFFSAFIYKKIVFPSESDCSLLFSMGPYGERKDYYEILNFVRRDLKSDLIEISKFRYSININLKHLICSLLLILKTDLSLPLIIKLSLSFKTAHYKKIIDYIEGEAHNLNYKKFCSFCSAHAYEAILDQFFRQRGIPTYTLQHGFYFLFNSPIVDSLAYENMISDKLLCWGQFTKDEYIKFGIPENRIKVAGYPRPIKKLKPYFVQKNKLNILLFCARVRYDKNNKKLMELCQNFICEYSGTVNITVKTHPSLNQSDYKSLCEKYGFIFSEGQTVKNLISSGTFDLAIAYNSTAYIDSYLNNLISLHYHDDEIEYDIQVLNDRFSDIDSLKEKIKFVIEKSSQEDTWLKIESRLSYLVGYGINRYSEYLYVG